MRLLTPTENKRLNELIGFLGITLAVLIALALISYSPRDASFNVSASSPEEHPARNWIGPVGAHGADLLFQGLGFAAFLLPVGLSILGWRWFRSQPVQSPVAKLIGYGLLLLTVPSLLALLPFPDVRGTVPAGGLLGALLASGLRAALNVAGAHVVAWALFLTALFLTTRFSFSGAHAWLRTPVGSVGASERLGLIRRIRARWHDWRDTREQERLRKRLAAIQVTGRPAVSQAAVSSKELPRSPRFSSDEEEEAPDSEAAGPILVTGSEKARDARRSLAEPKIARGVANYRLPSPDLLHRAGRSEALDGKALHV